MGLWPKLIIADRELCVPSQQGAASPTEAFSRYKKSKPRGRASFCGSVTGRLRRYRFDIGLRRWQSGHDGFGAKQTLVSLSEPGESEPMADIRARGIRLMAILTRDSA